MTSTASARPGAGPVEQAASRVFDAGLRRRDSAFTPGRQVWTAQAADALDRAYVQRLDTGSGSFVQKLKTQLDGADPHAVQLCAELLYINALPLSNVSGKAKRARIDAVLSWLPQPVRIPPELDVALDSGVFSGGIGFNTMLWSQLIHLVAFVQAWWQQPDEARERALSDPWAWKAFVESVGGGNAPSQRNALKYLAFPDTFQPIVNTSHRERIRQAYKNLLDGPLGDIDRDLLIIRTKLQGQSPDNPVDFYVAPWATAWKGGTPAKAGRHAWLVRPPTGDPSIIVGAWLSQGVVALPAARLRTLPPATTLQSVRDVVSADYGAVEYVQQAELANAFYAFLTRMHADDVIAAVLGDKVHLGVLEEGAPWLSEAEPAGRLRRKVTWRTVDAPLPVSDLPAPLPAHLAAEGSVVDLSEDVDLLVALMQEGEDAPGETGAPALDVVSVEGPPSLRPVTVELAVKLHLSQEWLQEVVDLLTDRQQIVLFGPPGTGKTYVAERLARFLAEAGDVESERVMLVQFHPSTSYEDFFEGYRPGEPAEDGRVTFALTPGPLSRLVGAARQDPARPYFLIIDEINRANLAKVFGELYYLLEYRDSGIRLLYRPDRPFTLPPNVFFIGTMNTADRSIALVDAAMRRRFGFVEMHPDEEPVRGLLRRWLEDNRKPLERVELLEALNARIADRDFKIGPSYLMKADAEREGGLERVWRYSILPLLIEHHYGSMTSAAVEAKYGIAALRRDLKPLTAAEPGPGERATRDLDDTADMGSS